MTSVYAVRVVPIAPVHLSQRLIRDSSTRRRVAMAMTILRLPVAGVIAASYTTDHALIAITALVAFVVADIYDGEIARSVGQETPARRLLDGTVDRLSVHLVMLFVASSVSGGFLTWSILIARDLAQAAVGANVLLRCRMVVAGAEWHRAYTLLIAFWGGGILMSGGAYVPLTILMVTLGLATLLDYCTQIRRIVRKSSTHLDRT